MIPLAGTGIPDYANRTCAVRVEGDGLTLQTTRPVGDLHVTVKCGGEILLDTAVSCGEPALLNFDLLRPVRDGENWKIYLKDTGTRFDPLVWLREHGTEARVAEEQIGIRLTAGLASDMKYVQALGMNTVIITVAG